MYDRNHENKQCIDIKIIIVKQSSESTLVALLGVKTEKPSDQ